MVGARVGVSLSRGYSVNCRKRCSKLASTLAVTVLAVTVVSVSGWGLQTVKTDSSSFCAAYFQPTYGRDSRPLLILFPTVGPAADVALPVGLPTDFRVIAFSSDGKAVYGQRTDPLDPSEGITKIEFKPTRQSIVPGSVGLGTIWYLTESRQSGKIFVTGWSKHRGTGECGAFEIDPGAGTLRALRVGIHPACGGANGPVSPDGRRVISEGGKLSVLDLETGAVQALKGTNANTRSNQGTWSPDGRWIAAVHDGRIALIDGADTSRRTNLGASGNGLVQWSPDSKYLLLSKSELRCAPALYSQSLEVVDVETRKRSVIKNSHCRISVPVVGWVDAKSVR